MSGKKTDEALTSETVERFKKAYTLLLESIKSQGKEPDKVQRTKLKELEKLINHMDKKLQRKQNKGTGNNAGLLILPLILLPAVAS